MTEDTWLEALRTEPSSQFEGRLRARLRAQEPPPEVRRPWLRQARLAAAAAVVLAVLTAVPAVRASVLQFVSLFRVVNYVPVRVDPARLDRLAAEHLDVGALIGEHVDVVKDPGPPVSVPALADAAAASGMTLALPQWLPGNTTVHETAVVGEREVRVTADGVRLKQVMDALGITDLAVPAGLDGQVIDIRVPPIVMVRYDHGNNNRRSRLFQARPPQWSLPDGLDVQALGEIGLRIVGLAPAEARQFAKTLDWHTTFIVPLPPNVSSFRQVKIGEHSGVAIQNQPRNQALTTTVVWSTPDRVFALVSILGSEDALAMAESVR
jgi:hypothetical protein